jgi:hypothetical protein
MILRYDIQLQTMIKAMTQTIAPAVDPADALAQEQTKLVIGTLLLMAVQLPLQYRFDRDELIRAVHLADDLTAELDECRGALAQARLTLEDSAVAGRALLLRTNVDPIEFVAQARAIRTGADRLVDAVFTDEAARDHRAGVRRVVLGHAGSEILRDRAWSLGQNFESDPNRLPAIEFLLAPTTSAVVTQ